MRHTDLLYTLALQKAEGIGDVTARKLLSHFGDAQTIFKAKLSQIQKIDGIGQFRLKALSDKTNLKKAEAEVAFIEQNNIEVFYFADANYPQYLRHCPDSPLLLFAKGNFNFDNRKVISIVGTRQMTSYGLEVCRKIISDLAPLDPVIVSGYAYGVDMAAHLAAIDNRLQTIGVVAHGLDTIYPKPHKKFIGKTLANGGFLSEFWSNTEPTRENFIKRNRIVAGLSQATIVVESAEKGGSLVTANMANGYDRDVFAVPGRTTDKYSQGCNNLIKSQKAHILTSGADLIYMLNWDLASTGKSLQKQLFVSLDADEQKVYDYLFKSGKQLLDVIAMDCSFPISRLSPMLLNLELKGAVRPLPGKLFEAV